MFQLNDSKLSAEAVISSRISYEGKAILCFCWVLQVDLKVDFLKSMMIATQTKWVMRFLKIFGFEKKNYDGKKIVFEDIFIKPH